MIIAAVLRAIGSASRTATNQQVAEKGIGRLNACPPGVATCTSSTVGQALSPAFRELAHLATCATSAEFRLNLQSPYDLRVAERKKLEPKLNGRSSRRPLQYESGSMTASELIKLSDRTGVLCLRAGASFFDCM